MDPDIPPTNPDNPQGQRPPEEEKPIGEHGQIRSPQDPAQDQTSDAQLNQGLGNQGQQSREDSQIEIGQEDDDSDEDLFLDDEPIEAPRRNKGLDGDQSDQTL